MHRRRFGIDAGAAKSSAKVSVTMTSIKCNNDTVNLCNNVGSSPLLSNPDFACALINQPRSRSAISWMVPQLLIFALLVRIVLVVGNELKWSNRIVDICWMIIDIFYLPRWSFWFHQMGHKA